MTSSGLRGATPGTLIISGCRLNPHLRLVLLVCSDNVDECATELARCDANAHCADARYDFNSFGGTPYTCACAVGFLGDGFNCTGNFRCVSCFLSNHLNTNTKREKRYRAGCFFFCLTQVCFLTTCVRHREKNTAKH